MDKNAIKRASFWSLGGLGARQLLRLVSNMILTRLLFPEAFGLMALVTVLMQGLSMLSDVGIHGNIIRSSRGEDAAFVDTAWTIQIIRGFGIFVCICFIAMPFAQFYEEPQLLFIVPAVGLAAVFSGFNSTALHVANRKLWLGRATGLAVVSQLLSMFVTITWAWRAPSVWALVAGHLAGSLLTTLCSHVIFPKWKNRLRWEWQAVHEIVHIGKWVFVSSALTFFAAQLDRLVLAKLVPIAQVGVYSIGFLWTQALLTLAENWAGRVFFPLASREFQGRNADKRSTRVIRRQLTVVSAACVSVFYIGMPYFFQIAYPQEYWGAVEVFQILLVGQWVRILAISYGKINMATGDPVYTAIGTALTIAIFSSSFYPFYQIAGMRGIAGAFVISQFGLLMGSGYGAWRSRRSDIRFDVYITCLAGALTWVFGICAANIFGSAAMQS